MLMATRKAIITMTVPTLCSKIPIDLRKILAHLLPLYSSTMGIAIWLYMLCTISIRLANGTYVARLLSDSSTTWNLVLQSWQDHSIQAYTCTYIVHRTSVQCLNLVLPTTIGTQVAHLP